MMEEWSIFIYFWSWCFPPILVFSPLPFLPVGCSILLRFSSNLFFPLPRSCYNLLVESFGRVDRLVGKRLGFIRLRRKSRLNDGRCTGSELGVGENQENYRMRLHAGGTDKL